MNVSPAIVSTANVSTADVIKLIPSESSVLYKSNGVIIIKNGRIIFEILRKMCHQKGSS